MHLFVAPLVGAGIEIPSSDVVDDLREVAPLVGAWIEMITSLKIKLFPRRRSPRGSVD